MNRQYKILIIDDNEAQRYSLKKTLQKPEYEFFEEHESAAGIDKAKTLKPDMVLLDVRMPGVDGFHICESIRKFDQHVPIVFVTANLKEFVDQVHGFEQGADEYVIQPYDPKELAIRVKALLRNKRLYDELLAEVQQLDRMKSELQNSNDDLKQVTAKLEEKNEYLQTLAITDPLTSLYNRKYFHQRIAKEISAVKRYKHQSSAAILDVHHYKQINDEYGTAQGDVVLKELASLLVGSVRNSDVVTRFEGGRFAIIFTHTPEESAMTKCNMMLESIQQYPFPVYEDLLPKEKLSGLKETTIRVKASISLAGLSYEWIQNEADLIQALNVSLQQAKQQGDNHVLLARNR